MRGQYPIGAPRLHLVLSMRIWPRFVRGLVLAPVGISLACGGSHGTSKPPAAAPDPAVRAAATAKARPQFVTPGKQGTEIWKEERRLYETNGYQLVWSDGKRPRPVMDALIRAISAAPEDGLDPADYDRDAIVAARQQFDPAQAATSDVRLTYALIKYAWHLSRGTLDPVDVDPLWKPARKPPDLVTVLNAALGGGLEQGLKSLTPQAPPYAGLRAHLARYRALAARGGGGAIADVQHAAGMKRGRARGAPLELTVNDVIRLIQVNMDRWRWMPDDLGPRYLIVNIPAFRLDVIENGTSVLDMKVVTGRKEDPTPVFADHMTHIVFSPYWNIPKTIVEHEILPKLETDPAYLERNHIEMVQATSGDAEDVRFRQRPGAGNSLGLVKFVFPNNFNVYLHDTPADSLFNRVERDFSHGCVRIEKPADLAKYVLRDQPEWTEPQILAAMHAGAERTVQLTEPLPVYLAYLTAWDDHGTLQIRPDVYGHDRSQLAVSGVERLALSAAEGQREQP